VADDQKLGDSMGGGAKPHPAAEAGANLALLPALPILFIDDSDAAMLS